MSAEIAWLPGLGPKRVSETLFVLQNSVSETLALEKLGPIARANSLAAGLRTISATTPDFVARWISELARAFEEVDPDKLRALINEDRIVGGFPEVTSLAMVEEEIQERRRHYRNIIKSALDSLPSRKLVEQVTEVVDVTTSCGQKHAPVLVDDLVDTYEIEARAFFERETRNIEKLTERLLLAAAAKRPDSTLTALVEQLVSVVKNWDSVAQPIQVSTSSRGLDHGSSYQVAGIVRSAAVELFNEHDKLALAQRLTDLLNEVFAEVIEVAERTSEDVTALKEIAERRVQSIEDANIQADVFRDEITYEAQVGLFRTTLRISPEGIEWGSRYWNLDSITHISWGGTRNSLNGIFTGTSFSINFESADDHCSITLRNQEIYDNFVRRLWKAVGVRLLTELLEGLRSGQRYEFGNTVIDDCGVEFQRMGLTSWYGRVYCRWAEVSEWSANGEFFIGKRGDRELIESFSYQFQGNIHILATAIEAFKKRGGDRLSSLLGNNDNAP